MNIDWLSLSQYTGGTGQTPVQVSVTDNLNIGVNRFATVRFTNTVGLTADLNITQTAFTEGLSFNVSPYTLEFQTSGETLVANVVSNSKWFVVEYPDWITVFSDNPEMIGSGNLYCTAEPNTGTAERTGNIKVVSYGEERVILAVQPSYTTLNVSPTEIRLAGVTADTASTFVNVSSSTFWEVSSYDSNYIQLSTVSGQSGTTRVNITFKNIPLYIRTLGIPFAQTITFTDHITSKTVTITIVSADNINDNAVTVTYNIPAAGSYVVYKYNACNGCPPWNYEVQDEYTIWAYEETKIEQVGLDNACLNMKYVYFYFSTPGQHKVKYYSDLYSTPFGVFANNKNISEIVFGDLNNGGIGEYTFWNSSIQKITLGMGNHKLYRYSFGNCYLGNVFYLPETCSLETDFSRVFYSTRAGTFFYCLTNNIGGQGSTSSGKGNGRAGGGTSCDHWFVWSSRYGNYSYSAKTGSLPVQYNRMIIQKNISQIGQMNGCSISTFTCSKVENKESKEYVVFNQGHYAGRISTIIFMGDTAPQFYTTGTSTSSISYRNDGQTTSTRTDSVSPNPMTVYYPQGGKNYTTNWSRSFVTLHSYTNIDDII